MKKISVLLALILCFMLLVSCGDTKKTEKTQAESITATETTTEAETTTAETFQLEDVELPFGRNYVNIDAYSFSYYNEPLGNMNVRFRMFNNHNLLPPSLCNNLYVLNTYEEYVDFYENVLRKDYQEDSYAEETCLPFAKEEYFEEYFDSYNLGVYFWAGTDKDGSGSNEMIYPYDVSMNTEKITVHARLVDNFSHDQLVGVAVPQAMVLIESRGFEEMEVVIDK